MFWLILFCCWFNYPTAYIWGGEQLRIPGPEKEAVMSAEVIRSREFQLPSQSISYSKDDRPTFGFRGIDDASWGGSIYDGVDSIGHFSLTCFENSCTGHINLWTTGDEYAIRPMTRNGSAALIKVNKQFMKISNPISPPVELQQQLRKSESDRNLRSAVVAAVDTDLILDICMIYTNEALAELSGSVSAMTAAIHSGNDNANIILENSAISLRYRIVCIKKVSDSFKENGNGITALLYQMTFANDGYMDEVQGYRDTYGADLFGLVVSNAAVSGSTCGVGFANTDLNQAYSFCAYTTRCVSSGGVFGHEIGHTMGCAHDRIGSLQSDPNFIAYGNCWEDASKSDCTCYSSIMVYECNTPQHHCTSCHGKPYMANPNVMESGNPTGLPNAACGLHIHNNRYTPIAYRKSVQPGGILFSVSPSTAVHTTCYSVNVTGWQLLRDLSDVPTVTINGFAATVISFDMNSVRVKSPVTSAPSLSGSVVVTASKSGRVTTLPKAFTFLPPQSEYNETFSLGMIKGTRWTSVGVMPWVVLSAGVLATDASSSPDGSSAILEYTAFSSASPQSGSCTEVVSSLSFSYWAYSAYSFCYGPFTVEAQAFDSSTWTTVKSVQGQGGSGPYIPVSVAIPANVQRIRLKAQTNNIQYCISWAPVKVRGLTVKSVYSCRADIACGNIAAPVATPTAAPSAVRTNTPTVGVTAPTAVPIKGPTTGPTAVPTKLPAFVPTATPADRPTTAPTSARIKRRTTRPTKGPTTGPTAAPTKAKGLTTGPTAAPTKGPTTKPTLVPTKGPTTSPTLAPTKGPTTLPTLASTKGPTTLPTLAGTKGPTAAPTKGPTTKPTLARTKGPTTKPTLVPTKGPTTKPTLARTKGPTTLPTLVPTKGLTTLPTLARTKGPTTKPTLVPTKGPTTLPTLARTKGPTTKPTFTLTKDPTTGPTVASATTLGSPTKGPSTGPQ